MQREGEIGRRAAAIYGETSSLYPQLIDQSKGPYKADNWDQQSAQNLHDGRKTLASMYGGPNPDMHSGLPRQPGNAIEEQQWSQAVKAAADSMGNPIDSRLTNMGMHQQGYPLPKGMQDLEGRGGPPVAQFGPFINASKTDPEKVSRGEEIAAGPKAYLDFYNVPPRKRR